MQYNLEAAEWNMAYLSRRTFLQENIIGSTKSEIDKDDRGKNAS